MRVSKKKAVVCAVVSMAMLTGAGAFGSSAVSLTAAYADEVTEPTVQPATQTATVSYTFEDQSKTGHEFPESVQQLLPQPAEHAVGELVSATDAIVEGSSVEDPAGGSWQFMGYNRYHITVKADDAQNNTFVGYWLHAAPVTYTFEASGTTQPLPASLQPPKASEDFYNVMVVPEAVATPDVEDPNGLGTWHFEGWQIKDGSAQLVHPGSPAAIMDFDGVDFVGKWTLKTTQVQIQYDFMNGTNPDQALPQEVMARLPKSQQVTAGERVMPDQEHTLTAQVSTVDDAQHGGDWLFTGWDKPHIDAHDTGDPADLTFFGSWKYRPAVRYRYVAADPQRVAPDALRQFAPRQHVLIGEAVQAAQPTELAYDMPDGSGVWTFDSYDEPELIMTTDGVEFVGKWQFTANTALVKHEFVSATAGKRLPKAVTDLLLEPALAPKDHAVGSTVQHGEPSVSQVKDDRGLWVLDSWSAPELKVAANGANHALNPANQFAARWKFKPAVRFVFAPASKDMQLPEAIMQMTPAVRYAQIGDVVRVDDLSHVEYVVPDGSGTWKFAGWDETELLQTNDGVVFNGSWEFTPTPKPEQPQPSTPTDPEPAQPVKPTEPAEPSKPVEEGTQTEPPTPGEDSSTQTEPVAREDVEVQTDELTTEPKPADIAEMAAQSDKATQTDAESSESAQSKPAEPQQLESRSLESQPARLKQVKRVKVVKQALAATGASVVGLFAAGALLAVAASALLVLRRR